MSKTRRALMMSTVTKPECVTSVISPITFNSIENRIMQECVFANLEAGKRYNVSIDADAVVEEKSGTSNLDFWYYGTFRNEHLYRYYNVPIGNHHINATKTMLCYSTGQSITALRLDTDKIKGTVTINNISIKEA